MTTLFALFAEVERELISERTWEGLAKAKASGKKLGRPRRALGRSPLDGTEDEIQRLLDLGASKSAVARVTGVSRPTFCTVVRSRGITICEQTRTLRHEAKTGYQKPIVRGRPSHADRCLRGN